MVKFSCQPKLLWMFGSNSKFKIHTFMHYSELWRLITSSYKIHSQSFLFEKLRILVYFLWLKFHSNPRSYELLRSILIKGCSTIDVIFYYFFHCFLTFQNNSANTMSQFNDIFFHQCVCMLVLNYFIVSIFFIWEGLGFEFHLQMCF